MTIPELTAWIKSRYGPIAYQSAGGIAVAVVGLFDSGKAIGVGSCTVNAVYDLYCDLSMVNWRHEVTGIVLLPWEIERRRVLDKKWGGQ